MSEQQVNREHSKIAQWIHTQHCLTEKEAYITLYKKQCEMGMTRYSGIDNNPWRSFTQGQALTRDGLVQIGGYYSGEGVTLGWSGTKWGYITEEKALPRNGLVQKWDIWPMERYYASLSVRILWFSCSHVDLRIPRCRMVSKMRPTPKSSSSTQSP